MEFTGERYVPGVIGQIKLEHLQRYALCRPSVRGRRVLDLACGEGYGSAMLASAASLVVGIDIDATTVSHARAKYGHLARVEFLLGACDELPLADKSIDVVVSFETIEHHDRQVEMVREIRRVLTPGGLLILSSPNKPVYDEALPDDNPFHVRELHLSELEALLRSQFPHVFFWGQRVGVGSFTYAMGRPASQSPSVLQALTIAGHDVLGAVGTLGRPVYFLAVCSDTPLEAGAFGFDSVILEPADDLYAQLTAQIQHQNEVHREDQAQVDRLQLELETVQAAQNAAVHLLDSLQGIVDELRAQGEVLEATHAAAREASRAEIETLQREVQEEGKALTAAREASRAEIETLQREVQEGGKALAAARIGWQEERAALLLDFGVRITDLERTLATMHRSKSWRWTAPMRDTGYALRCGRQTVASWTERLLRMSDR